MAQGGYKARKKALKVKGKAGKGGKVVSKSNRTVNKGKTAAKKGCELSPDTVNVLAPNAERDGKKTTKMINSNNEQQMAARCFQNQEKISLNDIQVKGRELAREIKRTSLKKKKTRIEEKLAKAKEKV
ncbi:unnamed protein product, partial [Choristocarpus tenellus]